MLAILLLILVGLAIGYFVQIPFDMVNTRYLALIFLGLLDSVTYSLTKDLAHEKSKTTHVLIRLVIGLLFGGFLIYFGEKSHIDLYLIALLPFAIGFALNMYKFLPK